MEEKCRDQHLVICLVLQIYFQPVNGVVGLVFACHLNGVGSILDHSIEGSEMCISGDRSSLSTWFGVHVNQ